MNLGVDAVFPIHSARDSDFRRGRQLGKKDVSVHPGYQLKRSFALASYMAGGGSCRCDTRLLDCHYSK
jgi:hypothetical protein